MVTEEGPCPFCRIVRQESHGTREIYRDSEVVAFLPTEPATLGHSLVIPHQHVQDLWTLEEDIWAYLSAATLRLAKVINTTLKPDGFNLIQSDGAAATQTVPHLHVHLVPRWADDLVGPIWPAKTDYTDGELDRVWHVIRAAIDPRQSGV